MAEHVIKLPDVGEGVAEAELVEWTVKVGDLVREDAVLAAVMTDKATVEIPSPVEGKIVWLGAEIGETVAVGTEIIRIEVAGESGAPNASGTPAPGAADKEEPLGNVAPPSPPAPGPARRSTHPARPPKHNQPRRHREPRLLACRAQKAKSHLRPQPFVCAPRRPASICARFPEQDRPAGSVTTISTRSLPTARTRARPPDCCAKRASRRSGW